MKCKMCAMCLGNCGHTVSAQHPHLHIPLTVELDLGELFLWGLHNFYPGCFPNVFFKRLGLFCKMIIVFGCIRGIGSVFPAPWSGFLVYSYISDTPIPARLSRYQSQSLIYYR